MIQFFRAIARAVLHAAGLYASIPLGLLIGLLLDGIILHPSVSPGLSGYPHPGTLILCGLVAGLIGGLLIESDRHARVYYTTVGLRTLVATAWLPVTRLAWHHAHPLTSALLAGTAVVLLVAATQSFIGLYFASRRADAISYLLSALAFITLGVFLQGDRVLAMNQVDNSIHGTLSTRRWCGAVETENIELRGITGAEKKYASASFTETTGDGTVFQSQGDPVLVFEDSGRPSSLGRQFQERFDEIVEGDVQTLTIRSPIPSMRLHWTITFAACFYLMGYYADPVSCENRVADPKHIGAVTQADLMPSLVRWARFVAIFGVLIGLLWIVLPMINFVSTQARTLEEIRQLTGHAELADVTLGGKPVVGNVWQIKVARPNFDDTDLEKLANLLDDSNGLDIDLSGTDVTDSGIALLRGLDSVYALRLRGTPITATALNTVGHLNPLVLDLTDTSIRTNDLHGLNAAALKGLMYSDPQFQRQSFAELLHFQKLEHLHIAQAQLTQATLDFWQPELEAITVEGIQIVDDDVVASAEANPFPQVNDGPVEDGPVIQVIRAYCEAIEQRNAYAVKSLCVSSPPTNMRELVGIDDWWNIRPVSVQSFDGIVQSGIATVTIIGQTADKTLVNWEFELVSEDGKWKVQSERWPN